MDAAPATGGVDAALAEIDEATDSAVTRILSYSLSISERHLVLSEMEARVECTVTEAARAACQRHLGVDYDSHYSAEPVRDHARELLTEARHQLRTAFLKEEGSTELNTVEYLQVSCQRINKAAIVDNLFREREEERSWFQELVDGLNDFLNRFATRQASRGASLLEGRNF